MLKRLGRCNVLPVTLLFDSICQAVDAVGPGNIVDIRVATEFESATWLEEERIICCIIDEVLEGLCTCLHDDCALPCEVRLREAGVGGLREYVVEGSGCARESSFLDIEGSRAGLQRQHRICAKGSLRHCR